MPIKISACRPCHKNTLRAFIDIELDSVGITIKDATWHEKDGKTWAGMPSRTYKDKETGQTKYAPFIRFTDKVYPIFQKKVAEAMRPHLAKIEQQPSGPGFNDDNISF